MLNTIVSQPERILLRSQIADLASNLNLGFVLDVGGGDGSRYRNLLNYSAFQSLDIDSNTWPDILASASEIPLETDSVDTIFSSQMLEHVVDPVACLIEISRVLKPGGLLILTVPFLNEMHSEPVDFWRFTKFGIENLLEKTGFQIEVILQRGNFWAVSGQFLIRFMIEKFHPYERPKSMLFLAPISRVISKVCLTLDKQLVSSHSEKYSLGWSIRALNTKSAK